MKNYIYLMALILSTSPALAIDFEKKPDIYNSPTPPKCELQSARLISESGDCMNIGGEVEYYFGVSSSGDSYSGIKTQVRFSATNNGGFAVATLYDPFDTSEYTCGAGFGACSFKPVVTPITLLESYAGFADANNLVRAGLIEKSIINLSDDEPFNHIGLFGAEGYNGVDFGTPPTPAVRIQGYSDLGGGVSAGAELTGLNAPGTFAGTVNYSGENVTAHLSIYGPYINGVGSIGLHGGITLSGDAGRIRYAASNEGGDEWSNLATAELKLGKITLAASGEAGHRGFAQDYIGAGGSAALDINGSTLSLGGRWSKDGGLPARETSQIDLGLEADVSETVRLVLNGGAYFMNQIWLDQTIGYAVIKAQWKPSNNLETFAKAEINTIGAWKISSVAKSKF